MWPDESTNNDKGKERAEAAKKVVAEYKKNGTTYSNEDREFGLNAKKADCSSLSCTILNESGQGDLFDEEKYTGQGRGTSIRSNALRFFFNFNWSGSYNGHSGNTRNSAGSVTIFRGESREANAVKDQLQFA